MHSGLVIAVTLFLCNLDVTGQMQTGRFMAADQLQSVHWRRLPAVPPQYCLQVCAIYGYLYAAVGSSDDP